MKLPFKTFEPTFFAGLLDDPVLVLRSRPWGRSLLVDCGPLHHLAKRVLRSVDAVFVSHAHMDHFMGLDTFVRQVHVAPRTVELFGPPGLAERLEHKLAGYDWNLAEDHWCTLRLHEVHPGWLTTCDFPGPAGFRRSCRGARPIRAKEIFANRHVRVAAALLDHRLPVLALRFTEPAGFAVSGERLAAAGLVPGAWLRELKGLCLRGELANGRQLEVARNDGTRCRLDAGDLYRRIARDADPASIGYLTDFGFTAANREKIVDLLQGVTLLICECTFLARDRDKARASAHLCSADLNRLLADLQPAFVLPMHLSKAYLPDPGELYRELRPPAGTTLLTLPDHVAPRPLLPGEVPPWEARQPPEPSPAQGDLT